MLDQRAQTLLKTLIERYIADGQPIGSRTLSRYAGLDLSAATIRNVMADLEELGFISSPHTSAGRIPTPRGFRFFVDTLVTVQPIASQHSEQISDSLQTDQPQRVLASAAQLLSSLSSFAGVVLTPRRSSTFAQIDFLRLAEKRILLIVVTPEGDIQNRVLQMEHDYSPSQLIEASNYINQHFSGLTQPEIKHRLQNELGRLSERINALMQRAVQASGDAVTDQATAGGHVVISGEHNLLGVAELSENMQKLRDLFNLFEQKTGLMQLLDASNRGHGVQIYIGGESDLVPIDHMSVVTAPYEVNGKVLGTLGVIGPTRMAYERVIPIVDLTARLVSSALSYAQSHSNTQSS